MFEEGRLKKLRERGKYFAEENKCVYNEHMHTHIQYTNHKSPAQWSFINTATSPMPGS